MGKTSIEWTDRTWNPVRGCSRVSEGCRHCYAETMAARFSDPGQPFHLFADRSRSGSKWTGRVELVESKLNEPLAYRGKPRVFVNSMSDLFHDELSDAQIDCVFWTMVKAPHCTFQVLTKRAHRLADWFLRKRGYFTPPEYCGGVSYGLPIDNVQVGVSVENQDAHDERVPYLQSVPAAVRFLSIEPLLGSITLDLRGIGWVIVGGESGPGARPMHLDWARSIRNQCASAGVPFFFKQWGAWEPIWGGETHLVYPDGRVVEGCHDDPDAWSGKAEPIWKPRGRVKVGADNRGRLLDGVEHSEFPCQ